MIQQRSAAKNLQNEVATFTQVKVALNDNGATSPAHAKLKEASGRLCMTGYLKPSNITQSAQQMFAKVTINSPETEYQMASL